MVYAGFWRRAAALLIDALILLIPSIVFGMIVPYVGGLVIAFLYFPIFMASELQGTPGKVMMGLTVTNEAGGRIDFRQALIRFCLAFVSWMFLCIGFLFALFTEKRQTLHDILAGTVVLQGPVKSNVDWIGEWTKEFKKVFNLQTPAFTPSSFPVDPFPSAPSSQATAGDNNVSTIAANIEILHRLFQQGVLTEAEFNQKKEEMLKKI